MSRLNLLLGEGTGGPSGLVKVVWSRQSTASFTILFNQKPLLIQQKPPVLIFLCQFTVLLGFCTDHLSYVQSSLLKPLTGFILFERLQTDAGLILFGSAGDFISPNYSRDGQDKGK